MPHNNQIRIIWFILSQQLAPRNSRKLSIDRCPPQVVRYATTKEKNNPPFEGANDPIGSNPGGNNNGSLHQIDGLCATYLNHSSPSLHRPAHFASSPIGDGLSVSTTRTSLVSMRT